MHGSDRRTRDATSPPKVWKRFVDDCFSIIKKTNISSFHDTLNSIDPHIDFTIENEKDGKIAFLDTLISRRDGLISIDVYRKPTHTDRYLVLTTYHTTTKNIK